MQEITETQTEQTNPEAPQKSPAEQAQDAVKIAKQMKKGYHMLYERELWSYLNALTAPGIKEGQKLQIKHSIVRALKFAVEFKTGEVDIELLQKGRLAKIENNLAMAMVKIDESNMLLMAENLRKQDEANEAARLAAEGKTEEGVKPLSELINEETKNETKENTNE